MGSGAIITLQYGRFANFVGSHFWNLQDETLGHLGHETMGLSAQEILAGKLFSHTAQPYPRLVIVDEKGCTGAAGVRLQTNEPDPQSAVLWKGGTEVIQTPQVQPSTFYSLLCEEYEQDPSSPQEMDDPAELDQENTNKAEQEQQTTLESAAASLDSPEGPKSFTDFLKTVLHPRSVVQVPLLGSSIRAPTGFGGITSHADIATQTQEEVEETLRRLAEESDVLEGLQLLCDPSSSWGGMAAMCTTTLADDYSNQTRLLYSVRPPEQALDNPAGSPGPKQITDSLSAALATAQWCKDCSLVLPMHAPATPLKGLLYCPERDFHSSALLAASLDTATLPFRVAPLAVGAGTDRPDGTHDSDSQGSGVPSAGETSLNAWCAALTQPAANFACIGIRLPAHSSGPQELGEADMRLSAREKRLRGITIQPQASADLVSKELIWLLDGRTDPCNKLMMNSVVWRGPCHNAQQLKGSSGVSHLKASLAAEGLRAVHHCSAIAMPLPVPLPFPHIFPSSQGGPCAKTQVPSQGATPADGWQCPMLTRTAASGALVDVLRSHADAIHSSFRGVHGKACLSRWGIETGDAAEQREHLLQSADLYSGHGFQSDDDDDEMLS